MLSEHPFRNTLWMTCATVLALSLRPVIAHAGDDVELPYVTEEACAEILADLVASDTAREAELNFATSVCYVSRLVDFRDRLENRQTLSNNGTTRSLPKAGADLSDTASSVDRQIDTAAQRSEEIWDDLAQGDPKAAYDLLRRLIGDQGSGS